MAVRRNLYLSFDPNIEAKSLKQVRMYRNLYVKIHSSDLHHLVKLPIKSTQNLTVEIMDNCKLPKEALEELISTMEPNRIIINLNCKIESPVLEYLHYTNFHNISIDVYWERPETLIGALDTLLRRYPTIAHFSLYPHEGTVLYLDDNYRGFVRYHHNMWSRDPRKYYAHYDLQTIRDRQYMGIGPSAITRDGYDFWAGKEELNMPVIFVMVQDMIDRLNYYIPMEAGEFRIYFMKLTHRGYLRMVAEDGAMRVHRSLIENLRES